MIKYHPSQDLLEKFVAGTLPASLSVAISAHNELCEACQAKCAALEAQQSNECFAQSVDEPEQAEAEPLLANDEFAAMFDTITASDDEFIPEPCLVAQSQSNSVSVKETQYQLPRVLSHVELGNWFNVGKLSRARYQFDEGNLRASLLHIDPGGIIPEHTHRGFEITLLLDGSFKDADGEYHKGDFIMLDARHQHSPMTEEGCLCLTVCDDALTFTQGMSKMLNPVGNLIY